MILPQNESNISCVLHYRALGSTLNKLKLLLLVGLLLLSAKATTATISGVRGTDRATLQILGDIQPGDEQLVREHLSIAREGAYVYVYVQSNGGDIHTAMQIGRVLRQHEARVSTDFCMSSCVLVLIAGVERRVSLYASKPGWGVGLHTGGTRRSP